MSCSSSGENFKLARAARRQPGHGAVEEGAGSGGRADRDDLRSTRRHRCQDVDGLVTYEGMSVVSDGPGDRPHRFVSDSTKASLRTASVGDYGFFFFAHRPAVK